jgi:cell division protein FtsL
MRRFRLSTLLLLIVIAAMGLGLIVQELRHRRRVAELEMREQKRKYYETMHINSTHRGR